jgi:ubiquinone/menaquinone biosynthesis C-methylase UbiE
MFSQSAELYDAIYLGMGKDYAREARHLREYIRRHKKSPGTTLLEAACGTGLHAVHLSRHFQVEGFDLDPAMLAVARKRLPGLDFHQADLVDFDLGKRFDVVTCLFSAIGYVRTVERLRQALLRLAGHLLPGGVLIVEPWFSPEQWHPGSIHAVFVDQPDLKVSRMNVSGVDGQLSFFEFHYQVGTPEGIHTFTERHELGLFTHEEYLSAFQQAGLQTLHDPKGLDGRGLYLGLKPK